MMTSVNNNMIDVRVIRSYRVKNAIKCEGCGLSYSKKHYEILFKSKKLVYFDVTSDQDDESEIICHDCFFRYLTKKSALEDGEPFEINFIDGHKRTTMGLTADLSCLMDDNDDD